MSKIFIPTDRIGLESIQKSISNTSKVLNELLKRGVRIKWHLNGLCFEKTSIWPEGHYYQCGFSTESKEEIIELLRSYGMIWETVEAVPDTKMEITASRIALYNGRGAGADFSAPLIEVLEQGGFSFTQLDDHEIRDGKLSHFDIFLVPGSPDAGECYYAGLGKAGYEKVRNFLSESGQYFGICGGAYLPLTSYDTQNPYWLNIVEATDTEGLDYWRTGSGFVRCRIEDNQNPIFSSVALGGSSSLNLVYWEGPSITIKGEGVRSLAKFESLLASGSGPIKPYWDLMDNKMAEEAVKKYYNPLSSETFNSLLLNRTAFAEAEHCGNRILLFSPHPEMGNIGYATRKDSLNFMLIYNGLNYLSCR